MTMIKQQREPGGQRQAGGFTLIELMIGMALGLLATLVIANVLSTSEGFRRSSTSGSDAQVNGGLALYALKRQLTMAGYGLIVQGAAQGCALAGRGSATLPPTLAPVLITAGADGASDSLRILASSKTSFSLPTKLVAPFYDPDDAVGDKSRRIAVASALGVNGGDLMAMVYGEDQPCQIFQVSANPSVRGQIDRLDGGRWNVSRFPDLAATPPAGVSPLPPPPFLVNLGSLSDVTFSLDGNRLRQRQLDHLAQTSNDQFLQSNVVVLKALYGKDTDGDDVVDSYDADTPTNNAGWLQVRAVRVAVLARSAQYEKDEVTADMPQWDVGNAATVAGSSACGTSQCIALRADIGASDWQHYRYKVFDTLVPLRNQLWRADFSVAPASAPASSSP